jgi:hypothetical protein
MSNLQTEFNRPTERSVTLLSIRMLEANMKAKQYGCPVYLELTEDWYPITLHNRRAAIAIQVDTDGNIKTLIEGLPTE